MKIFSDSKDTSAYYNAAAVQTFLNRKKGTKDYYNADNTFKGNPDSATKTAVSPENVANAPVNKDPRKTDKKRVLNAINNNDIRRKGIGIPWSNYIAFMGVKNLADKGVTDATHNTSSTLMQPLQSQSKAPCRCTSKKRICVLSKKSSLLKFKCGKYTENFKQKIRAQKAHSRPGKEVEVKFTKKLPKFLKVTPKPSKIYRNSSTSVPSKSSLKIPFGKSPSSKTKVDSNEKIKMPEETTVNKGKGRVEFEKSLSEPTVKDGGKPRRRSMYDLENLSILERASVNVSRNRNKDKNHKLCDAFGSTIFKHNVNSPLQMQVQPKSVTQKKSGECIRQKLSSHVDSNKQTEKTENEKYVETYKFSSSELHKYKDQESKASLIEDVLSVINYDDSDSPKRMSSKSKMKVITELITKMEIIKDLLPSYQSSSENVSIKDTLKRQLLTNEDALEMTSIVDTIIDEFLCANQMDGTESVLNENGTAATKECEGSGSNATLLVTWKDLAKRVSQPLEFVESQNKFRAENSLVDKYLIHKGKNKKISNQVHKSLITVDAADSNSFAHALWEGKATYQIQNIFECDSLENVSEKSLSSQPSQGNAIEQSKKAMKRFCDFENDCTCENLIITQFIKRKSQPTQNKTDNGSCNKIDNPISFNTLKTKPNDESDAANEMTEDSLEGARHKTVDGPHRKVLRTYKQRFTDAVNEMTEDSLEGASHKTVDGPPRKVLRTYKQRFTLQAGAIVSNSSRESSPDGTPVKTKPKKKVHYLTYPVQTSYNDHMEINLECSTNINIPKKQLPSKLPILRTRKVIEASDKLSRSPSLLNKGEDDNKSFVTVSGDTSATSIDVHDTAIKRRIMKMSKNFKAVSATDNKRPPYVKQRKIYSKSATETLPKPLEKRGKDAITKRRNDQSKIKCAKSRLPVLRESERSCSDSTDESKMSNLQEKDVMELCKKLKESVLQSENVVKCSEEGEKKDEIIMKDVATTGPDSSNVRRATLEKCKVEVMLQNEESENKNVYIIKALRNDKQTSSTGVVEKCLKLETANQTPTTCSKEIGTKIASLTLIAVTQTDISNEANQNIPRNTNLECPKESMLDEKEVEEETVIEDDIQEHATDEVNRESVGVSEKKAFTLPSITVYNKEYLGSLRCFDRTGMDHVFDNVEVFNYNVQPDGNYNRSVTFSEVSVNSDLRYLDSDDESEPCKDRKCFKRLSPHKCIKKTCPSLSRLHSSAIVTECACQYDGVDYQNPEMRCACTNWRESSSKIRRSRIPIFVRRCRYEMPKIERAECFSVASEANTSLEEKPSQHMWTVNNMDNLEMKFSQTSISSNEYRPQDKHCSNSSLCSNGHRSDGKRRSNSSLCSNGHRSDGKRRSNSSSRSSLLLSNRDISVCSSVREIQRGNAKDICDQACLAKMCNEKDTSTSTPKTQKSIASQFCSNEKRASRRLKATYKIRNNGSIDTVISISKEGLRSSKKHREPWGSWMASLSRKKHCKSTLDNEKCDKHSKKKYWKEIVSSFRNPKSNPRDNRRSRVHCDCDKQVSSKTSCGEIPYKKRCPSNKNSSRVSSRKTIYYNDDYTNYPLNTSTYCTIFSNECGNPGSIEVLYPAKEINTTETCESETITIAAAKHSKMCVNSLTRSIEMLTKAHHKVLRSKSEEYLDNEGTILDNTFCDFVVNDDDSTNFLNYIKKLPQCYHHCTCGQIYKIALTKNSENSL